jgi:hypothetical protein
MCDALAWEGKADDPPSDGFIGVNGMRVLIRLAAAAMFLMTGLTGPVFAGGATPTPTPTPTPTGRIGCCFFFETTCLDDVPEGPCTDGPFVADGLCGVDCDPDDTPTATPTGTTTPTGTATGTPEVAEACDNGLDDDGDGAVDCADSECTSTAPCVSPAPALSTTATVALFAVLSAIGVFGLFRRRRQ